MHCSCGSEMEYNGLIKFYDRNKFKYKQVEKYFCKDCKSVFNWTVKDDGKPRHV